MIGIVISREDKASLNIKNRLLEKCGWKKRKKNREWQIEYICNDKNFIIFEKEGLHLYYDNIDKKIDDYYDIDLLVFGSRHSGGGGKLLTAHPTGNWDQAEFGGETKSLSVPDPSSIRHILLYFKSNKPKGYDYSLEATHHGPTELDTPSLFVEIGSGEKEWTDKDAANIVASGILSLENRQKPKKIALGVGGSHYCPRFTRLLVDTNISFGHIIPDYCLPVSEELLNESFRKSNADFLVLDGEGKNYSFNLPVKSESRLREVSNVDRKTAEKIKGFLDEDVKLTKKSKNIEKVNPTLFSCKDLIKESQRINREKFLNLIENYCIGYTTDQGEVKNIIINSEKSLRDKIISELIDILREKYKDVTIKKDEIMVTKKVFSPEKANRLGVSEGPKFGDLSRGNKIEVDGKTISPEQVHKEKIEKFKI